MSEVLVALLQHHGVEVEWLQQEHLVALALSVVEERNLGIKVEVVGLEFYPIEFDLLFT
jgi:hypothetical protein